MYTPEHKKRVGGRIYYSQVGLAPEQDGYVSVSLIALIHEPKIVTRSLRLRIPLDRYIHFLEALQAQTHARFSLGRSEYFRKTRYLRTVMHWGV